MYVVSPSWTKIASMMSLNNQVLLLSFPAAYSTSKTLDIYVAPFERKVGELSPAFVLFSTQIWRPWGDLAFLHFWSRVRKGL